MYMEQCTFSTIKFSVEGFACADEVFGWVIFTLQTTNNCMQTDFTGESLVCEVEIFE